MGFKGQYWRVCIIEYTPITDLSEVKSLRNWGLTFQIVMIGGKHEESYDGTIRFVGISFVVEKLKNLILF